MRRSLVKYVRIKMRLVRAQIITSIPIHQVSIWWYRRYVQKRRHAWKYNLVQPVLEAMPHIMRYSPCIHASTSCLRSPTKGTRPRRQSEPKPAQTSTYRPIHSVIGLLNYIRDIAKPHFNVRIGKGCWAWLLSIRSPYKAVGIHDSGSKSRLPVEWALSRYNIYNKPGCRRMKRQVPQSSATFTNVNLCLESFTKDPSHRNFSL